MSQFAQFLNLTNFARLTGPQEILNDASRRTYLFAEAIRDREASDLVRGGVHIEERIKLNNVNNFGTFEPGQYRTPSRRTTSQVLKYYWRTYENNLSTLEYETDLNDGNDFEKIKDLKKSIQQDLETDHWDGLETLLFAVPSSDMEDTTRPGMPCASLPLFITENGLLPPSVSTIAQLDPTNYENWRNPYRTYDSTIPEDPRNGIFAAFDGITLDISYESPAGGPKEYYETPKLRKQKIVTNTNGLNLYQQLLRAGNDSFAAGGQDPSYNDPQWKGIPLRRDVSIDTALLDQTGATSTAAGTYTSQAYPTGKPRYFLWNQQYIYPVLHRKHAMRTRGPFNGGANQRDVDAVFKESWLNIVCRSRRRNGIVVPR